jgi:mannose-6-phosphate isomerase-like protein (cupin superfamily)
MTRVANGTTWLLFTRLAITFVGEVIETTIRPSFITIQSISAIFSTTMILVLRKANMKKRVFYNPKIKDKVTVLKTADETGNDHILVEVELAPGGGTPKHYHTSFTETFIAVEGTLGVDVGKKIFRVQRNQEVTANKNDVHRFYNPGEETIRFQVKISPAENRFLESLCIGYGLADDGLTNNKGIPKKFDHLAVLLDHSDSRFTGFLGLIEPILLSRARKARKKGVMIELIERYCH